MQAQVILSEDFTGGTSTTGFTINQLIATTTWTYDNPGNRAITGADFDGDFAIFDSDIAGSGAGNASAELVSAPFDASGASNLLLNFSHHFRWCCGAVATVQVWDGTNWNTVLTLNSIADNMGSTATPAVTKSINITAAAGGSSTAQVKFVYEGDWDYWWALDNITVEAVGCLYPSDLAVNGITTDGGTVSWTDNGSTGYDWAVTAGNAPDGTNELASGDGGNTTISGLNSGTTYMVFVRSDCGGGNLSPWSPGVSFATGITNDECSGATAVTVNPDLLCGSSTPGTVVGATASGVSSTCGGTADDDVWFMFTATATTHQISLINQGGSTTDMYMALWSGNCGSLVLVPNSCSDPQTMTVNGLSAGTTYYLQVYTWTSTPGQTSTFSVCVGTLPPPPANDDCDGAVALTVNPNYNCDAVTPGTVTSATSSGVTTTCFGTADDDVWFSFTATDTLHRISLTYTGGSTSDMYMALWTGSCGSLSLVPNSCSDPETMNVGGLVPGTTYYVQVYTWTSTTGQSSTFDVCVGTEPFCQPPLNVTEDSFTAPDAVVSWTDNGAMEYQWEVRTEGAPGSGSTGLVAFGTSAGSPANISGLAADVPYQFYVRSICSVGDTSAWSNGTSLLDGYCLSNFNNVTYEFVTNVTFAEINNTSVANTGGPVDYTDQVANVTAGQSTDLSVTIDADLNDYIYAFIDWNQNMNLGDAGEVYTLATLTDQAGPHTLAIAVPADAMSGNTRMRVMVDWNNAVPDPCRNTTYGEAEDYTVNVQGGSATYCDTYDINFNVEPICNVTFAGINNDSPSDVDGSPALEDFTAISGNVVQEETYPLSASGNTNGNYTTYITAFFDWDQDGTFESSVDIGSITNEVCTTVITADVTVPSDAALGQTRMRVIKNYNAVPTDPCGTYNFGQAEDYTLIVEPGVGISALGSLDLGVLPNPAHDRITLNNPNGAAKQVRIYDLVGNLVLQAAQVDAINISGLALGTYVLQAQDAQGNNLAHLRFVKQ